MVNSGGVHPLKDVVIEGEFAGENQVTKLCSRKSGWSHEASIGLGWSSRRWATRPVGNPSSAG